MERSGKFDSSGRRMLGGCAKSAWCSPAPGICSMPAWLPSSEHRLLSHCLVPNPPASPTCLPTPAPSTCQLLFLRRQPFFSQPAYPAQPCTRIPQPVGFPSFMPLPPHPMGCLLSRALCVHAVQCCPYLSVTCSRLFHSTRPPPPPIHHHPASQSLPRMHSKQGAAIPQHNTIIAFQPAESLSTFVPC